MSRQGVAPVRIPGFVFLPIILVLALLVLVLIPLAVVAQQSSSGGASEKAPVTPALQQRTTLPDEATPREIFVQRPRSKNARPSSSGQEVSFLSAVEYVSGGSGSQSVVIADVNHDGKPDLVITNFFCQNCGSGSESTVGVLLGNGDGTFQTPVNYPSGGFLAAGLAVADVNRDGNPDIIVANVCVSTTCEGGGSVAVLLGNGDGTFQSAVNYDPGGPGTFVVKAADLNGDGKLDLIVGNGDGTVGVLIGNGDGTFQPPVTYPPTLANRSVEAIAVADFNGDGNLDMAVSYGEGCGPGTPNCYAIGVFLGNGDGTFRSFISYIGIGGGSIAAADLNGDGIPDLVANAGCPDNSSCGYSMVGALLGNGDGSFQPEVTYYAGGGGYYAGGGYPGTSVAVADVNSDGAPDLLVANECPAGQFTCHESPMGVLLGNGDGTFQQVMEFESGLSPIFVASADVNGDGKPDVVVLNAYSGNPSNPDGGAADVLLNNTGTSHVSTNTALTSSLNPAVYGQTVTFGATVTSGTGTPAGVVAFYSGTTPLGSGDLASGQTSLPVPMPAGSTNVTAQYQGSGSFARSVSAPTAQVVKQATTTTSFFSSVNPAATGQSITYKATVASQYGGVLTGSVTFSSGSQTLGVVALSSTDYSASLTTSFATPGTYPITAQYSGDANNVTSADSLTQTVLASTGTFVSAAPVPAFLDEPITLTAQVRSSFGTPTGIVTFYIHEPPYGFVGQTTLSGGQATITVGSLPPGKRLCEAVYAGSSAFASSRSIWITEWVVDKYQTSTSVTSSLNPSPYGQAVTLTATVGSSNGAIPDGETVKFLEGGHEIGSGVTSNGTAAFTTSSLSGGSHHITVIYPGDQKFAKSSATTTQVVIAYSTTTTLSASLTHSTYGQTVTWTATVTSNGGPVPSGKVEFAGVGGSATLSGGVATMSKEWVNAGSYAVTADYKGDAASAPSQSATLDLVVNPAGTTTTVASSANPSSQGQSVTFTATVTTSTGVNSAGTVTFTAGGTTLGTVTLSDNVASISTSALPVGTTVVQATYNGETDFVGSSGRVSQVVNP